jgi:hypothetical protein
MIRTVIIVSGFIAAATAGLSTLEAANRVSFEAPGATTIIFKSEDPMPLFVEYCGLEDCSDTEQNI